MKRLSALETTSVFEEVELSRKRPVLLKMVNALEND